MSKLYAKKVVLFIVEGASERQALRPIFETLYKRDRNIKFEITNGDITSNPASTPADAEEIVVKLVKKYLADNKLKKSDLYQIIQIFDTDGTYIPDSAIIRGEMGKYHYTDENIVCLYPEEARARNAHKREILGHLLALDSIYGIPYEKYFMSANLDHVLYDEANLTADEKLEQAAIFKEAFHGKEHVFPAFLEQIAGDVPDDLATSWNYIKKDVNSLQKHTNLHLYFKLHPLMS